MPAPSLGFSSCRTETSFVPKIPSQPSGHPHTPPPCHVVVSTSCQDLSLLLLFLMLFNTASQCELFSSLNNLQLIFSLIFPHPSQGFALRSLRFYSVSTILALSSLSVHKFQESSGRVITFEHRMAMLLAQRSAQSELLPPPPSPLLHIFASFPTSRSITYETIRRENRKKPQTLGEHLLKEDEAEMN